MTTCGGALCINSIIACYGSQSHGSLEPFYSSCELVNELNESSLDWEVLKDKNGVEKRQRSYQTKPMRCEEKSIRDLPMLDPQQRYIFRYDSYVHLRDDAPWRVPILYGRRPKLPDITATDKEKGIYALFLMFLFRPHRCIRALFEGPAATARASTSSRCFTDESSAWKAIHEEFSRWREHDIEAIANRYTARGS